MKKMSEQIIQNVRLALQTAKQDARNLKNKDTRTLITSAVRRVAREQYKQVRQRPRDDVFAICEKLLETGDWRERIIAFQWAFQIRRLYKMNDFVLFERWLDHYVDDWSSCDDFCTHAFGYLIFVFPTLIPNVKAWIPSDDRWFRRGAAVVMIYGNRRGGNIEPAFEIADQLLMDDDDLVQKGYGWMLKEISQTEPIRVFDFVMERKAFMPRTSLRYAIEKLPPELRQKAMEK
jgi:3-methyladenine DNA glycosylase AlkD